MGRPPAVVIVTRYLGASHLAEYLRGVLIFRVRHGARLDAADTQWHLTSPTPYDPPLTYGGWRQSQALGARIASIIHSRENAAGSQASSGFGDGSEINEHREREADRGFHPSHRGKRRKHKVVIHSSPFLRCIQTSIAISAGMAQYQGTVKANVHPSHGKHTLHSGSPHIRAMDHGKSPHLSAILEPEAAGNQRRKDTDANVESSPRTLLRVDAFLGEWLSPEYFDKITPPPESKFMVAAAKADLLRHGELVGVAHASTRNASSRGHFPGGWGNTSGPRNKLQEADEPAPLADMSSLSQSLPRLARANSHSMSFPTKQSDHNVNSNGDRGQSGETTTYVPPIPSYAVSPSQPIPQGYVAHARDACMKVDYQWDSLRPPLEWGNGGDYGESWSLMHKRFRRGLHQMISWYRHHDPVALVRTLSEGLPEAYDSDDTEDEDTDTVLVLVTHGAGCNALIGALTNQPVLLDVGTASLTMALHKTIDFRRVASPTSPSPHTSPSRRRLSGFDFGVSDDYEVKIIASTDHLRAGSKFLPGSQLQRTSTLPVREKSPYRYERPHSVHSHHKSSSIVNGEDDSGSESDKSTPTKANRSYGIDKSFTPTSPLSSGIGLWTKPADPKLEDVIENRKKDAKPILMPQLDGVSDPRPDSSHQLNNGSHANGHNAESKHANSAEQNPHGRSIVPSGLWGAPPQALATERDAGAKRRWTLSQAS